jgi:hypothetical protein
VMLTSDFSTSLDLVANECTIRGAVASLFGLRLSSECEYVKAAVDVAVLFLMTEHPPQTVDAFVATIRAAIPSINSSDAEYRSQAECIAKSRLFYCLPSDERVVSHLYDDVSPRRMDDGEMPVSWQVPMAWLARGRIDHRRRTIRDDEARPNPSHIGLEHVGRCDTWCLFEQLHLVEPAVVSTGDDASYLALEAVSNVVSTKRLTEHAKRVVGYISVFMVTQFVAHVDLYGLGSTDCDRWTDVYRVWLFAMSKFCQYYTYPDRRGDLPSMCACELAIAIISELAGSSCEPNLKQSICRATGRSTGNRVLLEVAHHMLSVKHRELRTALFAGPSERRRRGPPPPPVLRVEEAAVCAYSPVTLLVGRAIANVKRQLQREFVTEQRAECVKEKKHRRREKKRLQRADAPPVTALITEVVASVEVCADVGKASDDAAEPECVLCLDVLGNQRVLCLCCNIARICGTCGEWVSLPACPFCRASPVGLLPITV